MIIFSFLPLILENQITKRVSQSLALENFQIDIKKLGFFNTVVGKIKTGQSLAIDLIDIDYSLKSLIQKKIKRIQISGLILQANVDENYQITLDDYDLKNFNPNQKKNYSKDDFDFTILPFLPESIEFKNSKILLNLPSQQITIPLEVSSIIKIENKAIVVNASLMPFGEKIEITATLNLEKNDGIIKIESKSFGLNHFSQIFKTFAPKMKIPNDLKIDVKTKISINKEKMKVNGILAANHPLIPLLPIRYGLDLDFKKNNFFTFKAANQYRKNIQFSYDTKDIIFENPAFEVAFEGLPLEAKGNFLVRSDKAEMKFEDKNVYVKNLKLNTDFDYDFSQTGKGINIKTNTKLMQIIIESGPFKAFIQSIKTSGTILIDKSLSSLVKMDTVLNNGEIESSEHKVKIVGMNANLPFSIPFRPGRPSYFGKFNINQCAFNDTYVCKISGIANQIESGILINGNVSSPDIKDFKLVFNSKAIVLPQNNINVALDFSSRPFNFSSESLSKFIPKSVEGINFDVNLSSNGKIDYSSEGIKSNLKIGLNNGNVAIPENNITVKGINTNLELKNLLTFQSKPAQVLTIDSIKLNDIIMNDAKIKYNIESIDSAFVESTQIKWCNGILSSEAFRVPSKDNNYAITLYCDRLELTRILEQIGAFHAEGNGTMSGRIPVTYSNGEVAFDNGFLFSTPGQGGKIIIDKADKLTAGIPMDTIQFSQLDLAKEALKNYDYKWAKLDFNTFEDTLFVNMKFDGKPSKKVLPFEYKEKLGAFVRVGASSRGSHFQGIKLDVNLKLPFNQVLKFGSKLKEHLN